MIGIINLLSRSLAFRISKETALVPPTRAVGSASLASSRIRGMSLEASTLSGALSKVTLRIALPLTTFTGGVGWPGAANPSRAGTTVVTPGAFWTAAVTAPIRLTFTTI